HRHASVLVLGVPARRKQRVEVFHPFPHDSVQVVYAVKIAWLESHGRERRSRRTAESCEYCLPPHRIVPRIRNMLISGSRDFPFYPGGQTCLARFAIRARGKPAHVRHGLIGASLRARLERPIPVL